MSDWLYLFIGFIVGAALGALGAWRFLRATPGAETAALNATLNELRSQAAAREAELKRELNEARTTAERQRDVATQAQTKLESAREFFAEQRRQIDEMDKKLRETFGALAAKALQNNNEQFVTLAGERLEPLREQLQRYEQNIKSLEKARQEAYGGLSERLASLDQRSEKLGNEAAQLVAALRQPGAKGKWGEITLRRIVELTGMLPHCDFEEQATTAGGQRPDLIVRLPNNRVIAIDSKVNTTSYLDAVAATDDAERKQHMEKYAATVRSTLKALAAKDYVAGIPGTLEFVVMFIPGEAFFSAALTQDPDLLIDGVDQKVILTSPSTLIALLLAVRHGWQQQQVAENAQRIADAGRELYDRLMTFVEHLEKIRRGLEIATDAYNKAVGSWSSRTLPSAAKLRELGAARADAPALDLSPLDTSLRPAPEPPEADTPSLA
ncbi:MAG: hypothetical protein HBSAPP02_05760 [Phycisphaerae bacterium]|nr:MAG: DNA recombination protein RmuC [Planctomycetia bacterium]RIK66051.1 MAG: DNA recombination protein RmuC [Planctomycetota bacterium]GJQ25544.1 MAG: hypothetical protein HBSAPP02_05760 [Phycisphaerae bacterium]